MMKVFIHSIPVHKSGIGLDNLRDPDTGAPLNKSKLTSNTKDRLVALYSGKTGALATGLDQPWFNAELERVKDINGIPLFLQHKEEQK